MRLKGYFVGVFLSTAIASVLILANLPVKSGSLSVATRLTSTPHVQASCANDTRCRSHLSLPMILEANEGQADPSVSFVARGNGATVLLTQTGIDVIISAREKMQGKSVASRMVEISFENQNPKPRSRRRSRSSTS